MAYNPGIVDRSGDILARGRLAGGMAALGGISQGIQTYQKNKLQNQILSSENEALIAGLQQLQQMNVPGVAQMAPPGMDSLIKRHLEGGGLNLNDSMKLNAMLGTTLKTAKTTQDMQAQAVQRELLGLFVPHDGDVDLGLSHVGHHVDRGDRHVLHARIADLGEDRHTDDFANGGSGFE